MECDFERNSILPRFSTNQWSNEFWSRDSLYLLILSKDLLDLLVIELVEMGHCSHWSCWRSEGAHG